jgi:hypothetical protein
MAALAPGGLEWLPEPLGGILSERLAQQNRGLFDSVFGVRQVESGDVHDD